MLLLETPRLVYVRRVAAAKKLDYLRVRQIGSFCSLQIYATIVR